MYAEVCPGQWAAGGVPWCALDTPVLKEGNVLGRPLLLSAISGCSGLAESEAVKAVSDPLQGDKSSINSEMFSTIYKNEGATAS